LFLQTDDLQKPFPPITAVQGSLGTLSCTEVPIWSSYTCTCYRSCCTCTCSSSTRTCDQV